MEVRRGKFRSRQNYLVKAWKTYRYNLEKFYLVSLGSSPTVCVEYVMLNQSITFQSFTMKVRWEKLHFRRTCLLFVRENFFYNQKRS